MRVKALFLCAMVVVLLWTPGVVSADRVLIHAFSENYYNTGGTSIVNITDPSESWTVGNTSGQMTWEVTEKVFHDSAANTTEFSYTVFNDTLASPITSFSLMNPYGFEAVSHTAPAGWIF